jgi:hypothetical protein
MANYILTFDIENTTFSSEEKWMPILRFSLNYTIEFNKENLYTFTTPINFNPKTKELIFSEYTLGKGFSNTDLKVEQLWNILNPLKTVIVEPSNENHAGGWLSYWHGAQGEKYEQKEKLDTFISWWNDNFNSIKEEIIINKDIYNEKIKALFSRSLID